MTIASEINDIVIEALSPVVLEVINESDSHNVPAGSESHFKLVIVSDAFEGQGLLARHRVINKMLAEHLAGPVHALGLHTHTPTEWHARGGAVPKSPPCRGGMKRES